MLVVGLVLIWRGVWYALDGIDRVFFGGSHFFSVAGGILLGFLILYLPDRDLKEIRKLEGLSGFAPAYSSPSAIST